MLPVYSVTYLAGSYPFNTSPGPGEAAERAARGGEGQTANGLKFLHSQGQGVRSTCNNGARRLKHAARGIAYAACAPRARLIMTLTFILSLMKRRGFTQSSPEREATEFGVCCLASARREIILPAVRDDSIKLTTRRRRESFCKSCVGTG